MPAFLAVMRAVTITVGVTLRKRIRMMSISATGAFDSTDCHHSPIALPMKIRITIATTTIAAMTKKVMLLGRDMGGSFSALAETRAETTRASGIIGGVRRASR